MRKATLSENTFLKNKFRLFITGLPVANRVISVGAIENEVGVVERPDKTKVSAGRTGGGSTDIVIELADAEAVDGYLAWYRACIDRESLNSRSIISDQLNGPIIGIERNYKRTATLVYYRQAQSELELPRSVIIRGCWVNKINLDEANIDTEEHQILTLSMQYDDAQIQDAGNVDTNINTGVIV